MELGEGAERSRIKAVGVQLSEHLWGFGAPDPAAEAPAGEAIGKFLRASAASSAGSSSTPRSTTRIRRSCASTCPTRSPRDRSGRRGREAPVEVPRHAPHDRAAARAVPVVLNRADSKVGLDASDVERVMKINVDAMIPSSRLVPTSLNKGRPVVLDETELRGRAGRAAAGRPVRRAGGRRDRGRPGRGRRLEEAEAVRPADGSLEEAPDVPGRQAGEGPTEGQDRRGPHPVQERLVESLGPRLYDATLSDTELEGMGTSACASSSTRRRGRSRRRRSS